MLNCEEQMGNIQGIKNPKELSLIHTSSLLMTNSFSLKPQIETYKTSLGLSKPTKIGPDKLSISPSPQSSSVGTHQTIPITESAEP